MATLNTLRTRGGIVVSIVIGIALLAFLLGDFGNQGASAFQERKMRVGEINGEKIGYTQFTDKVDYLTAIVETSSGRNSLSAEEQDQIRDQAWDFLVSQYALEPGFEALQHVVLIHVRRHVYLAGCPQHVHQSQHGSL